MAKGELIVKKKEINCRGAELMKTLSFPESGLIA